MGIHKKRYAFAGLFVLLVALLVACQTATPEVVEVIKTVVVTEVVETEGKEVVVEKTVEVVITATPSPEDPTPDPDAPKQGGKGNVYRVAILEDMTSVNVWSVLGPINSTIWNFAVQGTFSQAPFGTSYHRWDYVPGVAAEEATPLEQEGDFWVSTVQLRDDVFWSDGSPLTTADYAWTAEVALAFNLQGNWSGYSGDFLDHIEVIDATTAKLVYHTKPGLAIHQYGVLLGNIVNKAFWEPQVAPLLERLDTEGASLEAESDEYLALQTELVQELELLDPTDEPVGGAWTISQWEPGAFIEIERREDYYNTMTDIAEYQGGGFTITQGDKVYTSGDTSTELVTEYTEGPWFDKVVFSIYNTDAAILALNAGEVDFVLTPNGLSKGHVEQLSTNPRIESTVNPDDGFRYLAFNFRVPVLRERALRQAIACMIDKDFLIGRVLQNDVARVDTIIPPSNAYWHNPDVPLFCEGMSTQERMEQAVRILEEAGFSWDEAPYWREDRGGSVEWGVGLKTPDGEYAPDLTLLAPSAGYDPMRATSGVYIEQWMQQLGIPVEAQLMNFNRIMEIKNNPAGEWDMFILGWGVGTIPDYACYFLQPGSGWNVGLYDSEAFDTACNEFFAETDVEKAREIGFLMQEILAEDLPYIYLFSAIQRDAWDAEHVLFPFTDLIGGIGSSGYGLQEYVMAVE